MMDPLSEFRLDGEVAVVTGGSAGLGLAVADAFRAVGAQVAILDLAASGPDGFKVDVSDEAQVTSAFEQVAKRYGRVDVLFNNAGIAVRRPTMELTLEDWNKVVAVKGMEERTYRLACFALTGFANFASIGIQLGGIGGMAPTRRGDLARLGTRALLAGFVATLINACVASMLL